MIRRSTVNWYKFSINNNPVFVTLNGGIGTNKDYMVSVFTDTVKVAVGMSSFEYRRFFSKFTNILSKEVLSFSENKALDEKFLEINERRV